MPKPLAHPIHTGTVNGSPVRFFRGPDARPDMPWHALGDLTRALELPRALRRHLLQMTQRAWAGTLRTVATAEGVTILAPHFVAQGLIGAAVEAHGTSPSTPPAVRDGIVHRIEAGERLPAHEVRHLVKEAVRAEAEAAEVGRLSAKQQARRRRSREEQERERAQHRKEFDDQQACGKRAAHEAARLVAGAMGSDLGELARLLAVADLFAFQRLITGGRTVEGEAAA